MRADCEGLPFSGSVSVFRAVARECNWPGTCDETAAVARQPIADLWSSVPGPAEGSKIIVLRFAGPTGGVLSLVAQLSDTGATSCVRGSEA